MNQLKKIVLLSALLPAIYACSPAEDRQQVISSAQLAIQNGQLTEAEIKLKSLLTENANDGQARQLLAKVMLEQGNYASAVKEFERAIQMGENGLSVRIELLHAKLRAGEYDDVLAFDPQQFEVSNAALSEIYVLQGIAALQLNKAETAQVLLDDAVDAASTSQYAYLGQAYIASTQDDWKSALTAIDQAIKVNPTFAEAQLMKGQIHANLGEYGPSAEAYKQYVNLRPQSNEAKLIYVNSLIQNSQYEDAKPIISELAQLYPNQPVVKQMQGILSYIEGDYENAKRFTDTAMQSGLNTPTVLSINGISAYQLGLYEQAYRSLKSAAPDIPAEHPARKLLFVTQMHLGFEEEATAQFSSTEFSAEDASVISMSGLSLSNRGQQEGARQALTLLESFGDLSAENIARKGMLKLQLNDMQGIDDLKLALKNAPNLEEAQTALFSAYLNNQDFDALIEFAEQVIANDQESAVGYNMLARAHIEKEQMSLAEDAFRKALEVDSLNPPSLVYFAEQHFADGRAQEAADTLQPLVMERPDYLHALRLYYQFLLEADKSDEAVAAVERANKIVTDSTDHKFLLANVYFARDLYPETLAVLQSLEAGNQSPNNYWFLLIETHFRLNDWDSARETMDTWVDSDVFNEVAHIYRIAFYQSQTDVRKAREYLSTGMAAIPRSNSLKLLDIQMELDDGNVLVARSKLQEVDRNETTETAIAGIEGYFKLVENKADNSTLDDLLKFYESHQTKFAVRSIVSAYKIRRDKANLVGFLERRVAEFPTDLYSRKLLADALFLSNPGISSQHYQYLHEALPEDLLVINNLAWLQYEANYLREAQALVGKGLAIRSDVPFLLDTAGFIEKALGNADKAIDYFAQAYAVSPTPNIIIHYAEALVEAGKKDQARQLVSSLPRNLPVQFQERREKLLKSI